MAVTAAGLALLDPAVVTVALPSLGQGLRAGIAGLQWTMAAYALGVVALALLADAIGNRYGHRRTLLAGLLAYVVAAVGCGLAPTVELLVAARLVQGAGAALVIPAAQPRATATRWVVLAGPAAAGALVATFGWRAVFFAVALVGIVAFAGIRRTKPANGKRAHTRPDVAGSALLVFGLASLVTAMTAEPKAGFASFRVWLGAVASLIALLAFAVVERRHGRPGVGISDREGRPRVIALIPPGSGAALALYTLLVYAAWGGLVFFLLIQLQAVAEYSALEAGLAVLPAAAIVLAVRGRALADRIGPRPRLIIGPVLAALGTLLLYRVGPDAIYWRDVLPGTVLTGLGLAAFLPSLGSAARRAYAVHLVAARVGQLLAVAALPMLAGLVGAAYANPAAFHHGYRVALVWCAGLFVTGALTVLFVPISAGPSRPRQPSPQGARRVSG
jgi:MFS family permease